MKLAVKLLLKDIYHLLRTKNSREFLKIAFKYGDKPRYLPLHVNFLKYGISIPDALSYVWQFKEIFMDENYKFLSDTDRPIIYDCGSNIGLSCIYFKELYPNSIVHAYEADPAIFECLKNNLLSSGLGDVILHNKAVWIDNHGIQLAEEGADGGSIYGEGKKIKVDSVRLKELIDSEDIIDFLKLDVEGAETDIIDDCKDVLYKVKNFFIEYHSFVDGDQHLGNILNILSKNGFRYYFKTASEKMSPFVNKRGAANNNMDLQINIFACKYEK
jgi:FkbM family methyltransferase